MGVQHDCRKSDGMLLRDCQIVTDKQPTQRQLTLNWNQRTLPDCSKFESQDVQTCGYVFHDTDGRHLGQTSKTLWYRTKSMRTSSWWSLVGKTVRRHVLGSWMGKNTNLGVSVCSSNTRTVFYRCTRMTQTCPERRRIWLPCGKD